MKQFIIILFLVNFSFSQEKTIVDSESKEGIGFATILFYNNNTFYNGIYSDINGKFNLPEKSDKISISCIGYKDLVIDNVNNLQIIELEKQIYELDEVIVSNETLLIGQLNEKKSNDVGIAKGLEIGAFIKNISEKESKIKTVKFYVNKLNQDSNYRLHFYNTINGSNIPYIELTQKNTILTLKKGTKGLIEVNVESDNIILPKNGIYVTIECLDGKTVPSNKYILTKKESTFTIYAHKSFLFNYVSKNTIKGVGWINYNEWLPNNYKLTFKKDYNLSTLYVPTFGLIVTELE